MGSLVFIGKRFRENIVIIIQEKRQAADIYLLKEYPPAFRNDERSESK